MRLDHGVQLALHEPGLHDTTPRFGVHFQRPAHLGDVEGEPRGGSLAGEARTRAAGRDGEPQPTGRGEGELHIPFGAGDHDANGLAEVDGGIGGPQGARGVIGAQVAYKSTVEGSMELACVSFWVVWHGPVNFTSTRGMVPIKDPGVLLRGSVFSWP